MNIRKTTFIFVAAILILITFTVLAQEGVQNLAVVVNVLENPDLGISTSLSIIDLDEPDIEKAVENEIIPLGSVPSDIQIRGDRGYVVNTFSNNVQIIDLRNRVSLGEIPIGDDTQPQQIAFIDSSKAYVTCNGTNEIGVVDLEEQRVISIIAGGLKPTGITVLNGKAYVTNSAFVVDLISFEVTYQNSSVTVIDTQTDAVLKTIPVPTNATGITNDGESKVLVLSAGDFKLIQGELVIIDANTDVVEKTVELKTTPGFSLVINGAKRIFFMKGGFFPSEGLLVYDLTTGKWIHDRNDALADFAGGSGLAVDQNNNVYVAIPDWTGGRLDELRVMGPDETLIKTYRVGPGASIVAIARIYPIEIVRTDVNQDGGVDIFDLVLVGSNFTKTGVGIQGDVNEDGIVDLFDLVRVAKYLGKNVSAAPAASLPRSVMPDDKPIRRAIAALESFPDQSPIIRLITNLLRAYVTNVTPTVTETELFANYPNPFNPETWIPFQLSDGNQIVIRIYDQSGQLVRTLDLGYRRAGQYLTRSEAAFWNGRNETGERVTSGVYFYQLLADRFTTTRKMVILK